MNSDTPNKVCMRPDATGNYVQSDYCHQLEKSLAAARHSFKNFHRALCERFNYMHDEKDWERDQISLIEHIAALPSTAAVEEAKERVAFRKFWDKEAPIEKRTYYEAAYACWLARAKLTHPETKP